MNILNNINTVPCPLKSNSKTIELTVHTSAYLGLRLTLCYTPVLLTRGLTTAWAPHSPTITVKTFYIFLNYKTTL